MFNLIQSTPFSINRKTTFENMLDNFFNNDFDEFTQKTKGFNINIEENEDSYIVNGELPGFNKEDISIEYQDSKLTILANKKEDKTEENKNYIHKEIYSQTVSRSFYIKNIIEDSINAELKNGILTMILPKNKSKENKKYIEIK